MTCSPAKGDARRVQVRRQELGVRARVRVRESGCARVRVRVLGYLGWLWMLGYLWLRVCVWERGLLGMVQVR